MKGSFDNKLTDAKKADQDRRTEIMMLYVLMERYPIQVRERLRKSPLDKRTESERQRFNFATT
jgi:hypothetical protein